MSSNTVYSDGPPDTPPPCPCGADGEWRQQDIRRHDPITEVTLETTIWWAICSKDPLHFGKPGRQVRDDERQRSESGGAVEDAS